MRLALRLMVPELSPGRRRILFGLLAALVASGCRKEPEAEYTSASEPPTVRLIRPSVRDIVRVVEQPSFIEAYERTSIFPKLAGYIEQWKVDIGDAVKKDQALATLFIPELVEEFGTKKSTVTLDEKRVALALKAVKVATADVATAEAHLAEARAIVASYQAEVDRWDSEVQRLKREVERGIVDPQILLESINQLKSSTAARDAARATVIKAEAELLSRRAALEKAEVDVQVTEADLEVARSEARRLKALVGYITLPAPYDGVIVARNANTFDFVLPQVGDPTAMQHAPYLSHSGAAAPIFVVDRTDVVRVFVDIPEQDANYVRVGTPASVLVQAFRDRPIEATVSRTSWALNIRSRTLRAEIDLSNSDDPGTYKDLGTHQIAPAGGSRTGIQLLPGMYAYAEVIIKRPGVRALPVAALTYRGNQTFYWSYDEGKAVRIEVRTGVSDGEWIEVTNRRTAGTRAGRPSSSWTPIDGTEQVVLGDLSILTPGARVRVAPAMGEANVAGVGSHPDAGGGPSPPGGR